ncbi:MAG: hypothetical protein M1546_05740 [Chloroflexi bacterium]|nr:hypothetical protein [Chloroflexota bacterium]
MPDNLARPDETVKMILGIGEAQLAQWEQNIARLPQTVFTYSDEHEAVLVALQRSPYG